MKRAIPSLLMVIASATAIPAPASMRVTSADIRPNAAMAAAQMYPKCGGANIAPQVAWSGAPAATRSFVVTLIDVSVKPSDFAHWIVVDLPPEAAAIEHGAASLPGHARTLVNDFGDARYDGPCPPGGSGDHEYRLTVWAMPSVGFSAEPRIKAAALLALLERSSLDHATVTGFARR